MLFVYEGKLGTLLSSRVLPHFLCMYSLLLALQQVSMQCPSS